MRIGLDLSFIEPGATGGMEVLARSLVPRLPAALPDAEWVAFCAAELADEWRTAPWHDAIRLVALPFSAGTRIRRTLGQQTLLAGAIARAGVDLVHAPGNIAPLAAPARLVVTVNDLIYKRFPDTHAGLLSKGVAALVPASAHRARRVIAISHAGAEDLRTLLRIPASRIDVVPCGPGRPPGPATPERELRERLGLGDGPLVLSPSAHRAHKNLGRLLEAIEGLDATVVLPGYPTGEEDALRGSRTVVCGWLSDADLEGLYGAASLLAFPSLAEGFGLPVLEAMRRGLPVACADATSLPEVAGDAALLFDPLDVGAIRAAVARLLGDEALRDRLAAAGIERARRFTWEAAAAGTAESYRRALA